jgi:hypothetical protein
MNRITVRQLLSSKAKRIGCLQYRQKSTTSGTHLDPERMTS